MEVKNEYISSHCLPFRKYLVSLVSKRDRQQNSQNKIAAKINCQVEKEFIKNTSCSRFVKVEQIMIQNKMLNNGVLNELMFGNTPQFNVKVSTQIFLVEVKCPIPYFLWIRIVSQQRIEKTVC